MKTALILSAILVIALALWIFLTWLPVRNIEKPKYTVIKQASEYELRKYEPYLVAKTEVAGDQKKAINEGFRTIAAFIFGDNTRKQPVAMTAPVMTQKTAIPEPIGMTAPVMTEKTSAETYTIAFVMPSEYSLDTLPTPNDEKVMIEQIPETTYAVLTFSGFATEARVTQKEDELKAALERDGIETQGTSTVSQYNPPWSPWFLRRNEIWIQTASK